MPENLVLLLAHGVPPVPRRASARVVIPARGCCGAEQLAVLACGLLCCRSTGGHWGCGALLTARGQESSRQRASSVLDAEARHSTACRAT